MVLKNFSWLCSGVASGSDLSGMGDEARPSSMHSIHLFLSKISLWPVINILNHKLKLKLGLEHGKNRVHKIFIRAEDKSINALSFQRLKSVNSEQVG